ncbi:MAG: prepilin peptidase [Candidatus Daviesbacteria bacterium]|nr:prepilin peptidase [Candidatus Daviesbacteria bacterium]
MVITLTLGFLIGTILGSFVKALADRSLTQETFLGRSSCEYCHKQLKVWDLIPVISFLLLHGKCRYCHKSLSPEYLIVEVVMGILIAGIFWLNFPLNSPLMFGYQIFFVTVLATIFLTDLKEMFIPDRIIYPAIITGIIWQFLLGSFVEAAIAAILIGGFFLSLVVLTRGKGMGGGDIKLGAFIGLSLGLPYGILAVMLAFLTGATFGIAAILLSKKHFGESLPFGPFLVLGSLITLFWGTQILQLYLKV